MPLSYDSNGNRIQHPRRKLEHKVELAGLVMQFLLICASVAFGAWLMMKASK